MATTRNAAGHVVGQGHHRATHTDAEVRAVLAAHHAHRWGWRRVAASLGLNAHWVKAVLAGRIRLTVPPAEGRDWR
jgi:hypothetical protein